MTTPARLAIVGDYDPTMYTHLAIDTALGHVREQREHALEWSWIATPLLANETAARLAARFDLLDAVWLAPGSPYASMDGALAAVRHVREHRIPFLGVCGGFQHAIIEYARNVAGLTGADHAESNPGAETAVVAPLSCSLIDKAAPVFLDPTCRTASIYGRWRIVERYHCNYGLNPMYRAVLQQAGLNVVGEDDQGDVRVVELPGHPFFIATLFQPQLESSPGAPAPLVRALVDAAIYHRDHRASPSSAAAIAAATG
jgi:CTP synthase (UTP-ammonia lyase)